MFEVLFKNQFIKTLIYCMRTTCLFYLLLCFGTFLCSHNLHAGNKENPIFQGKPVINSPAITGNYPDTPFLFYIPTSGQRPVKWEAENLPKGLKLNPQTGVISGKISQKGKYTVTLKAKNALGSDKKNLVIRIGDKLLLTPPMGWNSWNTFGRDLSEELVLQTADSMINNGMRDLGYTYINIDDFWQLAERGADGHLQINTAKFPRGIKYVADYLHERGFKLGIYSDAADKTCGGVCGSYGYEETDAKDFADWGVDLLKYDYCNAPSGQLEAIERYTKMGKALRATDRSIVYSICEWGQREPWKWAKKVGGELWRVSGDIGDVWDQGANHAGGLRGILNIIEINAPLDEYAGPAGWNDPDMLVVGIGGNSATIGHESTGCTDEQYKSHFALWCMMASPLLCGNDIRDMDDVTSQIILNKKLIAINQDQLGVQASRTVRSDYYDIWIKPLSDGSKAVACFNRTDTPKDVELNTKSAEGLSFAQVTPATDNAVLHKIDNGVIVKLAPFQCTVLICR